MDGQATFPSPYLARTLLLICCLATLLNQQAQAAVGECNFEKYATGCFSQANFVCDRDTNLCKCHPEMPVLIEQRICVKRAKTNEICQYNEQCDNANGLFCFYPDHTMVNTSHLPESPRCRTIKVRHKQYNNKAQPQQQTNGKQNSTTTASSSLPRLVWIFLLACLFGLVILLLIIKSQHYRIGRSFQTPEDRLSINSELDVPPPYEVAIRMKL